MPPSSFVALPPIDLLPFISDGADMDGWVEDACHDARLGLALLVYCFWAARVCLLSVWGCNSRGTALVLEDLRLPPSIKDVGPSAVILFHGGDMGRGVDRWEEVESTTFRFFGGGPS